MQTSDIRSILVVDDDPVIRKELVELFTLKGWDVSEAEDGKIAFDPDIPNLDVRLVSSGHVLGSASVSITYNDKIILFTSDIGGRGQLTIKEPITKIDADILVIEATFGSPELVFPSREDISMEILKWSADVIKEKRNVVFSAGKLGSAQELIKMFNNLTNLRVVTHGEVTPVSEVYQKHGINLEYFDSKSEEGREILRDGEAILGTSSMPQHEPDFEQFLKVLRRQGAPDHLPLYEHIASGEFIVARMGVPFDRWDMDEPAYWRTFVDFWLGLGFDCIPMEVTLNCPLEGTWDDTSQGSEAHAVIRSMEDFEPAVGGR